MYNVQYTTLILYKLHCHEWNFPMTRSVRLSVGWSDLR